MDLLESVRRDRRQTWIAVIALGLIVTLVAQPAIAAAVQAVRVKGAVKVKDSTGDNLESEAIASLGLLGAEGAPDGALKVQNFAGGGGLLGAGECDGTNPARPATVTVPAGADTIVTAIIVTGAGTSVSVSAPDLDPLIGAGPVATFETTAGSPQVFVGLGNGLTVSPSELVFACAGGTGEFVILGQ